MSELLSKDEAVETVYTYECGHRMGECTCYDCAAVGCDNFTERAGDKYCREHAALTAVGEEV